ncbi:hypothetical protein SeLEV6574_g08339 [Synchytrium endobioticum]|uniref:Uncharacterized protein n=1 Tax=Synchytrium endobioticum TaxID=286115 RepID=A0A507C6W7_9FUNG|nr:hypothetical protein SeLEV6574_g08339 [Synchytrium endobioticum]
MRTFSIFFSLLVLCHQVLSTTTNQRTAIELKDILAHFQAREHAVEEHRALYDISFALTAPTKEGIEAFNEGILYPLLQPKTDDSSRESCELRMQIDQIGLSHYRFFLRMIINVYKYHDLKFPENPLASFERQKLLELAKNVQDQAIFLLKRFTRYARFLRFRERNLLDVFIDDDCWGFKGVRQKNLERVVAQNEKIQKVLAAEHEKLDRLLKSGSEFNGQVKLKTKAEIDELFKEEPSCKERENIILDVSGGQMVYSWLLVAAEFHHVLADRDKLVEKYLSLKDTDLPQVPRSILKSFKADTTLDDSRKSVMKNERLAAGYLGLAKERAEKMGNTRAKWASKFVKVSEDLLAKHQPVYMPELKPYINEYSSVTRSDTLSLHERARAESSNPKKSARAPVRAISKFSSTDQSPMGRFVALYGDARSHDSMNIASSSSIGESKASSSTRLEGSRTSRTDGSGIGGIQNGKLDR